MAVNHDFSSRIWLIGPDGQQVVEMAASSYDREADFQSILAAHPALIDGRQVDPDDPRRWLLVSQEAVVPDAEAGRWALDHLFVDQDGIATLVEVKRKSDTRLRREVVGQMLDYAANGSLRWTAAYLGDAFTSTCQAAGVEPEESLATFLGDPERVPSFWEMVESNLRAGRMRLLFVADEVPAELLRIVEFLNEHMSPTEVLALELRYFSGGGFSTHVPRILGRTLAAVSNKETTGRRSAKRRSWDRETFLEDAWQRLPDEQVGEIADFLDKCARHFELVWGSGAATGSFTPRRPGVSVRGPISVYSDGRIEIKPSWLNDTSEAEAWRDLVARRLEQLGWTQPIGERGRLVLRLPVDEWLPRRDALLAALLPV